MKRVFLKIKKIIALLFVFAILQNHILLIFNGVQATTTMLEDVISSNEIADNDEVKADIDEDTSKTIRKEDKNLISNLEDESEEDERVEDSDETSVDTALEESDEIVLKADLKITDAYNYLNGAIIKTAITIDTINNIEKELTSLKYSVKNPTIEGYTISKVFVESVDTGVGETDEKHNVTGEGIEGELKYLTPRVYPTTVINVDYVLEGSGDIDELELKVDGEVKLVNNDEYVENMAPKTSVDVSTLDFNNYRLSTEKTSIYKGYLYANAVSDLGYETEYTTYSNVFVENVENEDCYIVLDENVDNIKVNGEEDISLKGTNHYISTYIDTEEFNKVFGGTGYIEIYTDGTLLGRLDSSNEIVDGNFTYTYNNNSVSNVEYRMYGLKDTGNFKIYSDKAIKDKTVFDRVKIKSFESIENTGVLKNVTKLDNVEYVLAQKESKAEIKLEETESRIDFVLYDNVLSTEEENNVDFRITLKNNEEKYELFKNPTINVELPTAIQDITVDNVNLLHKNGLSMESWNVETNDSGNKVIKIKLSGIQNEYLPDSSIEGTTVMVNTTINLDKLTGNGKNNIKVTYSNEIGTNTTYQNLGEDGDLYPIEYVAKNGLVKLTKVENYNNAGEVLENYEMESKIASIDVNAASRVAKVSMAVVNNYSKPLSDVVIIGKIPTENNTYDGNYLYSTFSTKIEGPILTNGLPAKVYYSEEEDPDKDSTSWVENVSDYSKIRTYKIEIENPEILVGDKVEFNYNLELPANIDYNESSFGLYTVSYKLNGAEVKENSIVGFKTEEKEISIADASNIETIQNLEIGSIVKRAGVELTENDSVNEAQLLRYSFVIKNTSSETVRNIVLKGTAENANSFYYDVEDMQDSTSGEMIKSGFWKEDTEGKHIYQEIQIDSLEPNEEKVVSYQVIVKSLEKVTEPAEVYGKAIVTSDNTSEQTVTTIKNKIEQADLALVVGLDSREEYGNEIINTDTQQKFKTSVTNISDRTLEDIYVKVNLSKLMNFDEVMTEAFDPEQTFRYEETAEGKIVTYLVNKLEPGQTVNLQSIVHIDNIPEEQLTDYITIKATSNVDGKDYYSNDYIREVTQTYSFLEVNYTANVPSGSTVVDGQDVKYKLEVTNKGNVETYFDVSDKLPYGLKIEDIKVKLPDGTEETKEATNQYFATRGYIKPQEKLEVDVDTVVDRNLLKTNQNSMVNIFEVVPSTHRSEITEHILYVEAVKEMKLEDANDYGDETEEETLEYTMVEKEGVNFRKVEKDSIKAPTQTTTDNRSTSSSNNSNSTNTNTKTNNNTSSSSSNATVETKNTYSISGRVWVDSNKNGLKEANEEKLKNVTVKLYKASSNKIALSNNNFVKGTKTDTNGEYYFNDVENGTYIVILAYDSNKYTVTKYQVNGTKNEQSSSVIVNNAGIENDKNTYAITDLITIADSNSINNNMGLKTIDGFDMGINAYVSKVTINDGNKEEVKTYDKSDKIYKVDLSSKTINRTTLKVEYVVEVSNVGDMDGTVKQIAAYFNEKFELNNKQNLDWSVSADKNAYNSSLKDETLVSGQTRKVKLVLTIKMTGESTGVYDTIFKIAETSNGSQIEDQDVSNNSTKVQLMITIRTGAQILTTIIIVAIVIAYILFVVLSKKLVHSEKMRKLLEKLYVVFAIVAVVIIVLMTYSNAASGRNITDVAQMSLTEYYNFAWDDYIHYLKSEADRRIQCIEASDRSFEGLLYKGNVFTEYNPNDDFRGQRYMISIADYRSDSYSYNSVRGSGSGSNRFASLFSYAGDAIESMKYGDTSYKGLLAKLIRNYGSELNASIGVSINPNQGTNPVYVDPTFYNDCVSYLDHVSSGGTGNIENKNDDTEISVKMQDGTTYVGPITAKFPTGTKLFIGINGSYTEYSGNVYSRGSMTRFGDGLSEVQFYIPADAFGGANLDNCTVKLSSDEGEGLRARLIIFAGRGSGQNEAVIRGDGSGGSDLIYTITSGFKTTKYVTKVDFTGSSGLAAISGRQLLTNAEKAQSPVRANIAGSTIEFYIKIKNTTGVDATFRIDDTITNNTNGGMKYLSGDWSGSGTSFTKEVFVRDGQTLNVPIVLETYSNIVTVEELNNMTFELAQSLKDKQYAETYVNTAVVTNLTTGETKEPSNDYVAVEFSIDVLTPNPPSGSLRKYIIEKNGVAIDQDRSEWDNTSKNDQPVVVEQGDTVKYEIKLTNNQPQEDMWNGGIYNVVLDDIADEGLEIISEESLTGFDVAGGGEHYSYVTAKVVRSNLELFNLKNEVEMSSADYIGTGYWEDSEGNVWEFPIYWESVDVNDYNTPDSREDYVRLKELEIAGQIFNDQNKNGFKDSGEELVEDVKVELIDTSTNSVVKTDNSGDGTYEFKGFNKGTNRDVTTGNYNRSSSTLRNFVVRFTYDGITYETTPAYSGSDNIDKTLNRPTDKYYHDSNAKEAESDRKNFNKKFEHIIFDNGVDAAGTRTGLTFEKEQHKSKRIPNDNTKITADSFGIFLPDNADKTSYACNKEMGDRDYLLNIDVGLFKRPQLDLDIDKDFVSAQVRVNNYTLDYDYLLGTGKPTTPGNDIDNEVFYNPNSSKYVLKITNADYEFRIAQYANEQVRLAKQTPSNAKRGQNAELNIDLLYKVTVYNESDPEYGETYAVLNEVVDYNTSTMSIVNANLDSPTGTALTINNKSLLNDDSYTVDGYETNFITGLDGRIIHNGESITFYVLYEVDKNAEGYIELGEKQNIVQISEYSTYVDDARTEPMGLVDVDSNNANLNRTVGTAGGGTETLSISDHDKYDDNSYRTDITIVKDKAAREINGLVFEDTRSIALAIKPNVFQYIANGEYKGDDSRAAGLENGTSIYPLLRNIRGATADQVLSGMTVQLIELADGKDGKVYEETIDPTDKTNTLQNVYLRTGSDGTYSLKEFIPGKYIVRFKFGDTYKDRTISYNSFMHNGQDYKATQYLLKDSLEETEASNERRLEMLQTGMATGTTGTRRISDARENELRRVEVMSNSEIMNNQVANKMRVDNFKGANIPDEAGTKVASTLMSEITDFTYTAQDFSDQTYSFADTVSFSMGIENRRDTKDQQDIEVEYMEDFNSIHTSLYNVDFGVEYRPESYVELNKKIKEIKLETSTGQVVVDIHYNEDGTLTEGVEQKGIENLQSIDNYAEGIKGFNNTYKDTAVQGFRYLNVDEEILQGAKLSVVYYITVNNQGEVDTVAQNLINEGGSQAVYKKLKVIDTNTAEYGQYAAGDTARIRTSMENVQEKERAYARTQKLMESDPMNISGYTYGYYTGGVYYYGANGLSLTNLAIVPLRVQKIIDFIDNDATFKATANNEKNKSWAAIEETELMQDKLIDGASLKQLSPSVRVYLDDSQRRFTGESRDNLIVNLFSSELNRQLVKPIIPLVSSSTPNAEPKDSWSDDQRFNVDYSGYIMVEMNQTLSSENDSDDMVYDNTAEVVEFNIPTGRITNFASTIGNIKVNGDKTSFQESLEEVDASTTETVRLTPPTGEDTKTLLVRSNKQMINIVSLIAVISVIVIVVSVIVNKSVKNKLYK